LRDHARRFEDRVDRRDGRRDPGDVGARSRARDSGAVWGAVLFALWPDLEVVGHFSTMYPLLMALLVGGAASFSTATIPGALAGGILFGLTGATDVRGLALAACFVATATLLHPSRAAVVRLAVCAAAAALVAGLLLARVPVRRVPLAEQIATQSLLAPVDNVLMANVRAFLDGGPHLLAVVLLLVPIGVLADPRSRLPLAAPVAAIAALLAIVPLQFRYFLPVAPFLALLAAGGLSVLLRRAPLVRSRARRAPAVRNETSERRLAPLRARPSGSAKHRARMPPVSRPSTKGCSSSSAPSARNGSRKSWTAAR
jgi:hypothetical protein